MGPPGPFPRALPRTLATCAPSGPGPSSRTVSPWSQDPKMRAGNVLAQPTGPNRIVKGRKQRVKIQKSHSKSGAPEARSFVTPLFAAAPSAPQAPEAPENLRRRSFVTKRAQQKSTNTAQARDSEQKLPTGSTRVQTYRRGLRRISECPKNRSQTPPGTLKTPNAVFSACRIQPWQRKDPVWAVIG